MSTISVSNRFACRAKGHTCEHALELVGVFETASLFQLGDHARLRFV